MAEKTEQMSLNEERIFYFFLYGFTKTIKVWIVMTIICLNWLHWQMKRKMIMVVVSITVFGGKEDDGLFTVSDEGKQNEKKKKKTE